VFRLYGGKKRGQRHSGSRLWGSLGEAFFFGAIFVLGLLSLISAVTTQSFGRSADGLEWGQGFWALLLVFGSFILIGGGGLIRLMLQVGASAERRSALAKKAADIELIGEALTGRSRHPFIPNDANMTNSPGVTLAFRLPSMESPAWKLAAGAMLCLGWVLAAGAIAVVSINRFQADQPEWLLMAFALPFLAVGGWSFHFFVRQMWIEMAIGPTSVEISDLPLCPGQDYEAAIAQSGRLEFNWLELWLICEEEATYQQGTDVRTERRRVHRQRVFRADEFAIEPAQPFEAQCGFRIPDDAMHSFQSEHNAVHWKLIVVGQATSFPIFERTFPIVVYPLAAESA
jgi:hypothetical protein